MTTKEDQPQRQDVYSRITNQIIAALEQALNPGRSHGTQLMPPGTFRARCAITGSPMPESTS